MGGEVHSNEKERRCVERRQRRLSLVLNERRSGFDRRVSQDRSRAGASFVCVLEGLRDRPRTLLALLVAANLLNLADFFLTLNVLADGGGEANPILRPLFEAGPAYAGGFKFVTVLAVSLLIWRCRRFRRALEAALILVGVFAVVFCYHMFGLVAYSN